MLSGRQRLELAALDVEEELLHAGITVAAILAITMFAALALAAVAAAVVVLLWDRAPVAALLGTSAVFALAASLVTWWLMRALRAKPRFLAATLDELGADARWFEEQRA